MTINQRLKKYIEVKELKAADMSRVTGLSEGLLSNLFNTHPNKPSADTLNKILNYYKDLNSRWLLTGEGEMIEKNIQEFNESSEIYQRTCKQCTELKKDKADLRLLIEKLQCELEECKKLLPKEKRKAS